jgi:hypothetical protein
MTDDWVSESERETFFILDGEFLMNLWDNILYKTFQELGFTNQHVVTICANNFAYCYNLIRLLALIYFSKKRKFITRILLNDLQM